MTITSSLVPNGLHHAKSEGTITVGPAKGQVPALGLNQLLKLTLPFQKSIWSMPGFEDQVYVITKPLDANVTDIRLDAQQFEYVGDQATLRLRVDISAAPADVQIWVETHHSTGR